MKAQLSLPTGRWCVRLSLCFAVGLVSMGRMAEAATSSADSNVTTVDTRPMPTGTLTGRVRNAAFVNVTAATVTVEGTGQSATTDSQGLFSIPSVTASSGYVLTVSAAGYAIKRFPNTRVMAGTSDVGDLLLGTPVNLPAQLRPLVPDVNPPVTTVEEGGTAYRYYQVVATDGKTLVGGVTVGLRRAGGAVVPQDGDTSTEWAGYETGKPDADGLLRLRLPATAIGSAGSTATFEVMVGATVAQTFTARVRSREYEQVWKQTAEGEASGSAAFRVGLKGTVSSELRHELRGGVVQRETIGWTTEAEIKLGYETKVHDKGGAKFTGSAGAGFYIGLDFGSAYSFPSDTMDEDLNVEKIYAAYAPFLKFSSAAVSLLPGETSYEKLVNHYASLVAPRRTQTAWNGHVGGDGELNGGATVPLSPFPNAQLHAEAKLDGAIGGFAGVEQVYGRDGDEAGQGIVFGFEVATAAGVKALMQNIKFNGSDIRGLSFNREFGFDASVKGRVWTPQTSINPTRVDLEIARETRNSGDLSVLGWKGFELGLSAGEKIETTETLSLAVPPEYYGQFASHGEVWGLMKNYAATQLKARPGTVSEFFGAIIGDPYQRNQIVGYERKAYRAQTLEIPLSDQVKFLKRAFGLDLSAEFERGAEGRTEKGVLWQVRRLALESYPAVTAVDFPTDGYWRKQEEWMKRGFPKFSAVVQRVENFVDNVQGGIVVVRDGVQAGYLQVVGGVQQGGQWISSTVTGLLPGNNFAPQKNYLKAGDLLLEPLPNQLFGVGGVVRFDSTNEFTGTATLTLNYSDTDIAGLNEADLRIYRLGDGSNHWQLVGGVVNALSNTVTATITNLGTFAIAPPLPSGNLVLSVASNTLSADGLATSLITVSNLMLNNGQVATQSWLYTVSASGVQVVESDVTTNYSGVQLAGTNGVLRFTVRAPLGGNNAKVSVVSVAGDATGELAINLVDNAPPLAPSGVSVSAVKSRLVVSWQTNAETDLAGYRVYYRAGVAGPPWDGTAAVEGSPSPVSVAGTNVTLRGLATDTNYFVALAAVDTTGNESAPAVVGPLTPTNAPPQPPAGVAVSFGADGTNYLSWALSEDDGYNNRDVARYDIYRAVFPGGAFVKIGEAPAGVGLFSETNLAVAVGNFLRYAVTAVATNGTASVQTLANRFLAGGNGVDNDGDGMADDWEAAHSLNPQDPADALADTDGDGLTNLQEYQLGRNPVVADGVRFAALGALTNGLFALTIENVLGRTVTLESSTNLVDWFPLTNFPGTNGTIYLEDATATNAQRFYRAVTP